MVDGLAEEEVMLLLRTSLTDFTRHQVPSR